MKEQQKKISFVNKDKTRFYATVQQRVDEYFREKGISHHANASMVVKTLVMLSIYFVPYALIMTMSLPLGVMWFLTIVMGIGLAGIGMSVMHDANHGAYSANSSVNDIIGKTLNLVGGDAGNWKIQHNILHHTYTNIHGQDEDVNNKMLMRFSPGGRHRAIQHFQVFYAFVFYSLLTLWWSTGKDFVQLILFSKEKHQRTGLKKLSKSFFSIVSWKVVYFLYMIVLPLVVLDIAWWQILIGFCTLHFIAGLILSVVFQLAHVVEGTSFPEADEIGNIENEWAIHQVMTTADFSKDNYLITYYLGGLNFQVVHHLFPRVCHVHYKYIAPIVRQTAYEFGLPYHYNTSFASALGSHLRMLKKLGKQ